MLFKIDFVTILVLFISAIMLTFSSGAFKGICDGIAHHNSFEKLGLWWTRDSYHESKYRFLAKYPFWAKTKARTWIVKNVFIMVLDAWHFFQLLSQVFDHLLFIFPTLLLLTNLYSLSTVVVGFVVFTALYLFYQVGFRIFYD